jgi:transposase
MLAAEGLSNVEIARRVDMSPDRIGDWRRRFLQEGLEGLEDRARSGRPCRFPPGRGRPGDKGSAHRRQRAIDRLQRRWPNLILVHLPIHASWLNQIEIFYSILQRKVLEPNDYDDLGVLARTLNQFERHWNAVAEPFEWNFTRDDLAELMDRLAAHEPKLRLAA